MERGGSRFLRENADDTSQILGSDSLKPRVFKGIRPPNVRLFTIRPVRISDLDVFTDAIATLSPPQVLRHETI